MRIHLLAIAFGLTAEEGGECTEREGEREKFVGNPGGSKNCAAFKA